MLSIAAAAPASMLSLAAAAPTVRPINVRMETAADIEALSKKLNPTVGFWDPLGIVASAVSRDEEVSTLGWYRHAEIKHGRVAMAAFVGFIVQSNGIVFPWKLAGDVSFADIAAAGGPGDQWDALPTAAKLQILGAIGFLELWGEIPQPGEEKHYVKGGKPGYYPSFGVLRDSIGHPNLDLWDPFGFTKKMSAERKQKALLAEVNNGRLAMLGIFGFISASKGLMVPGLDSISGIKPYAGEYMAPFTANDDLPFVADMLAAAPKLGNLVPNLYQ